MTEIEEKKKKYADRTSDGEPDAEVVADALLERAGITDQNQRKLFELRMKQHADAFYYEGLKTPVVNAPPIELELREGAVLKRLPPYHLSWLDKLRMDWNIAEGIMDGKLVRYDAYKHGVLEHLSPAFIADRKGHYTKRAVVDYRLINRALKMPAAGMPDVAAIFDSLNQGFKYFNGADLALGYHQLRLSQRSQSLLAIGLPNQEVLPTVLPLGPGPAPGIFQSFSNSSFGTLELEDYEEGFPDDFEFYYGWQPAAAPQLQLEAPAVSSTNFENRDDRETRNLEREGAIYAATSTTSQLGSVSTDPVTDKLTQRDLPREDRE